MAAARRIVIVYDGLTDVVSAYVADTKGIDADRAPADNHILLERDRSGSVVGIEIMGASALVPARWRSHPDRAHVPTDLLLELDRWLSSHWADIGHVEARLDALDRRLQTLEHGDRERLIGGRLDAALREALAETDGVDAIMRTPITSSHVVVYVAAREHGIVDRERLFDVQDALAEKFDGMSFELAVRAHQDRPFHTVAPGSMIVFAK